MPTKLEDPPDALPWLLESPSALIFGREDCGLTNAELNYAQRLIRIPASDAYTSLNLAQAVAVCCYELYKSVVSCHKEEVASFPGSASSIPDAADNLSTCYREPLAASQTENPSIPLASATFENLEGYYRQLETLLLKIGYLHPHTAASRMEKFRRLYNRAYPSVDEVAMLRGILSQVEWALTSSPPYKGGDS